VLLLLALATGCASKSTITGKVTYQDKPLTGGVVLFVSESGKGTGRSEIGTDGSYTIENMPTGQAKIAVDTTSAQGTQPPGANAPKGMMPPPGTDVPSASAKSGVYGSGNSARGAAVIPDQYKNADTSGLTYTVKGGSQTHNIDLK
jgi:hypothetical protein